MSKMFICQICKKNPATIHLTELTSHDGHSSKKEMHFCQACASAKGLAIGDSSLPQLLGLAAKKMVQKQQAVKQPRKEPEDDISCPNCGMTWSQFGNRGRFGCPHDYEAFDDRLSRMASRQLAPRIGPQGPFHIGKKPDLSAGPDRTEQTIRSLEKRLKLYVAEENYEQAAAVKAQMDELRAKSTAGATQEAYNDL